MKQRIDSSQLQQLTPSQQEKLRALWKPETGDWAIITGETLGQGKTVLITKWYPDHKQANLDFIGEDGFCSYTKENLTPLVSIGQCIELLHTRGNELEAKWIDIEYEHDDWGNTLEIGVEAVTYSDHELINVLWEAVKSIL